MNSCENARNWTVAHGIRKNGSPLVGRCHHCTVQAALSSSVAGGPPSCAVLVRFPLPLAPCGAPGMQQSVTSSAVITMLSPPGSPVCVILDASKGNRPAGAPLPLVGGGSGIWLCSSSDGNDMLRVTQCPPANDERDHRASTRTVCAPQDNTHSVRLRDAASQPCGKTLPCPGY